MFELFSAKENDSKRVYPIEKEHTWMSAYQRDRDSILYSKSFQSLGGKTQLFLAGVDDHIRNRLTHTLEVSQISRTISMKLGLNLDLTEAIALGHDIGHTPFGHIGERTLNAILNNQVLLNDFNINLNKVDKGFKHNWQGLRIAIDKELINRNNPGLNLSEATLFGILNHTSLSYKKKESVEANSNYNNPQVKTNVTNKKMHNEKKNRFLFTNNFPLTQTDSLYIESNLTFYSKYNIFNIQSWTIESEVVSWADEIAQRHNDIVDGLQSNILDQKQLINSILDIFHDDLGSFKEALLNIRSISNKDIYIASLSKWIIDFYVNKAISSFSDSLTTLKKRHYINTSLDFQCNKGNILTDEKFSCIFSLGNFENNDLLFSSYLKGMILNSYKAQTMDGKAEFIILQIFSAYLTNPQQLPDSQIYKIFEEMKHPILEKSYAKKNLIGILREELQLLRMNNKNYLFKMSLSRIIADYISGMTDQYCIRKYESLYGFKMNSYQYE